MKRKVNGDKLCAAYGHNCRLISIQDLILPNFSTTLDFSNKGPKRKKLRFFSNDLLRLEFSEYYAHQRKKSGLTAQSCPTLRSVSFLISGGKGGSCKVNEVEGFVLFSQ